MNAWYMSAFPWDLMQTDMNAVLDRLRGELALSGVALWLATPPVLKMRARDLTPRIVRTRGGILFEPSSTRYVGIECPPQPNSEYMPDHAVRLVYNALEAHALNVRGIISAAHLGGMAERHPEFASRNAWGTPSDRAICLANPGVQDFLTALIGDIKASFDLESLVLTDFAVEWSDAYDPRLASELTHNSRPLTDLATCFCESCRCKASANGVDVFGAERDVRNCVARIFNAAPLENDRPRPLSDAIVAMHHWRHTELNALRARFQEECRCPVVIEKEPREAFVDGDLNYTSHASSPVLLQMATREDLLGHLRGTTAASETELAIAPRIIVHTPGDEIVALVTRAAEAGYRALQFDSFGEIPEASLPTIRQAIRFARREGLA